MSWFFTETKTAASCKMRRFVFGLQIYDALAMNHRDQHGATLTLKKRCAVGSNVQENVPDC